MTQELASKCAVSDLYVQRVSGVESWKRVIILNNYERTLWVKYRGCIMSIMSLSFRKLELAAETFFHDKNNFI